MPQTFWSGEKTNKFDNVLPAEAVEILREEHAQMMKFRDEMSEYHATLDKETKRMMYETVPDTLWKLDHQFNQKSAQFELNFHARYDHAYELTTIFLRSKFVRFLNFFGCWFIYLYDGSIRPNIFEYQQLCEVNHLAKLPFFTRVKRKFISWKESHSKKPN